MFQSIKGKLRDMSTIRQLCEAAEAHALADRQRQPGAEHFLLAALDLQDGTAQLTFKRVGVNPEALKPAIEHQYRAALEAIGLSVGLGEVSGAPATQQLAQGVYQAAACGQEVMQALANARHRHAPLLGAHVVAIIAAMPYGVAARALRSIGVDLAALRAIAEEVTDSCTAA